MKYISILLKTFHLKTYLSSTKLVFDNSHLV